MKKIIFIFLFLIISIFYLPTTENNTYVQNERIDNYYQNNVIGKLEVKNTNITAYLTLKKDDAQTYLIHQNKEFQILEDDSNTECDIMKEFINYLEEEFYHSHPTISINLDNKKYIYQIFSIIKLEEEYKMKFKNFTYKKQLDYLSDASIFETKENISTEDDIINIKTCFYNPINAYLLISAKKI